MRLWGGGKLVSLRWTQAERSGGVSLGTWIGAPMGVLPYFFFFAGKFQTVFNATLLHGVFSERDLELVAVVDGDFVQFVLKAVAHAQLLGFVRTRVIKTNQTCLARGLQPELGVFHQALQRHSDVDQRSFTWHGGAGGHQQLPINGTLHHQPVHPLLASHLALDCLLHQLHCRQGLLPSLGNPRCILSSLFVQLSFLFAAGHGVDHKTLDHRKHRQRQQQATGHCVHPHLVAQDDGQQILLVEPRQLQPHRHAVRPAQSEADGHFAALSKLATYSHRHFWSVQPNHCSSAQLDLIRHHPPHRHTEETVAAAQLQLGQDVHVLGGVDQPRRHEPLNAGAPFQSSVRRAPQAAVDGGSDVGGDGDCSGLKANLSHHTL
eukprot:m.95148 g.95148  ORF g.95148 m.95148 type:complete len:376 (+) comp18413_c0_seq1:1549-2676(+)